MAKYTAELRTLIDNNINIFDFQYTRTDESRTILSDEDLQQGFIDRYYFREVGFETVERFKHYLKMYWLENIQIFDKLLIAYDKLGKEIDPLTSSKSQVNTHQSFNDTPKNKLDNNKNYASSTTESLTEQLLQDGLAVENLEKYHDKIKDIQSEFYDIFDPLFMQIF